MEPPSIVLSCPSCGRATGRLLLGASSGAWGAYFHCDRCRHTWFVTRDNIDDYSKVRRINRPSESGS